ncbi:hypothetical protein KC19_3G234700 [Ceratodon purpureus]|uniref:TOD1/MUCI70 glycosyltransferase-like domain-containing protein n=1 Tax=Ceratodon purpureus TaxID=3225 RepID=A0A8T0INL4_CERPU|nr:hypothetical protein KC19_3G234700 [Ceratodon purpureus]
MSLEEWRGRYGSYGGMKRWWWMVGGEERRRSWGRDKEKEKERRVGGFAALSVTRRAAGVWTAFLIVTLSLVMILNNASLIKQHVRDGMEVLDVGGRAGSLGAGVADLVRARVMKDEKMMALPEVERRVLKPHPCKGFTAPAPVKDPKRTGPRPCPVCYLEEELAISQVPAPGRYVTPVLKRLRFVSDPNAAKRPMHNAPGSSFGGYPSLEDRAASFDVREDMTVHCGFVKGPTPGVGTGFDVDEDDRNAMRSCYGVVVASAIFGNYDQLQQPKNISEEAKKSVCFFMFVDEETEAALDDYDENFRSTKQVGLWRVVVVHNLPYRDPRRTGKIPKLLLHRLFPNVRFSIWADGKLEIVQDPYKILERFLWRTNETFAISEHYRRFDVFEEADANKAAGKYSNKSIDDQVGFYKSEGLTPYSRAKLPITSDVPEGCVIIREHTPIANLMSCLWFNEVDRFTSRDQLSFGIVRDKLSAAIPGGWRLSMFKDCERRNFVVQGYHRDLLLQRGLLPMSNSSSVAVVKESKSDSGAVVSKPVLKVPVPSKRGISRLKSRRRLDEGLRMKARLLP